MISDKMVNKWENEDFGGVFLFFVILIVWWNWLQFGNFLYPHKSHIKNRFWMSHRIRVESFSHNWIEHFHISYSHLHRNITMKTYTLFWILNQVNGWWQNWKKKLEEKNKDTKISIIKWMLGLTINDKPITEIKIFILNVFLKRNYYTFA